MNDAMNADEFNAAVKRHGPSRRKFCLKIGISRYAADDYALGRQKIKRTVALAVAALDAGLAPAGSNPDDSVPPAASE